MLGRKGCWSLIKKVKDIKKFYLKLNISFRMSLDFDIKNILISYW